MFNQKKIRKTGSVNIPVAMRREMNIQPNDVVDVQMRDGIIALVPVSPRCIFCSGQDKPVKMNGRYICKDCAEKALSLLEEVIQDD